MTAAVLSIGANLGDRDAHLQTALDVLGAAVTAVSPVYTTAPWGVTDQAEFHNAVLLADDDAIDPPGWLDLARRAEQRAGRIRERRWGPRTLDVDVITVDGVRSADPELTLPHPRAHQRAFVLVPWLAVDPDAELPGYGRVELLVAALPVAERDGVRSAGSGPLLRRAGALP
jgi:2-amino-4-hydroxy-6-hydroxymethyldihydropteridine diphosphokinase